MRFSQRIGKKLERSELQIESMDDELRAALWNCFQVHILEKCIGPSEAEVLLQSLQVRKLAHHINLGNLESFFRALWADHFKLPLDTLPNDFGNAVIKVRKRFFGSEWYEVYDLIEFVTDATLTDATLLQDNFTFAECCNRVLERELSGYRLVGTQITPITDKLEIREIEEALETSRKFKFAGTNSHLREALSKLSDRKSPDYRNSIKESISAVEAVTQIIAAKPNATLGDALKLIEDTIGLHPALKRGFMAIYGYTSDADGIRHAMIDEPKCDFEDAKYMLVSCTAFVNYLIMKAIKAGIKS